MTDGVHARGGQIIMQIADNGGASTLTQIESHAEPFELILTDVPMPAMDGFDLVAQVKSLPRMKATTILRLTSGSMPRDSARCRQLGVDACLTKPIRHSDLLTTILRALNTTQIHMPRVEQGIAGTRAVVAFLSAVLSAGSPNLMRFPQFSGVSLSGQNRQKQAENEKTNYRRDLTRMVS